MGIATPPVCVPVVNDQFVVSLNDHSIILKMFVFCK